MVEIGEDVLFVKEGDICSVPFNIACGRCRMCNEGKTGICLNVNPARAGAAYGYVDMGGWVGGQAEYVMVPFADFNLLKFPDRDQALEKILDLTMLSDIFPTGYHGAYTAGVTTGSTVYVAGAGPVGLAAAYSAQLLGASVVIVGDMNADRLAPGRELRLRDGRPQLGRRPGRHDRADRRRAGGGRGRRRGGLRGPRPRGGRRRGAGDGAQRHDDDRPGRSLAGHPRASTSPVTRAASTRTRRSGQIGVQLGLGWAKSHSFTTGQCPVKRYNRQLMNMILADKAQIAKAVNAVTIGLDDAPQGYQEFDQGAAKKYVIDPHGMVA